MSEEKAVLVNKPAPQQSDRNNQAVGLHSYEIINSPPSPETAPNITGRYQEKNGLFTLHINQSGIHIECWLALSRRKGENVSISAKNSNHSTFGVFRFGGDFTQAKQISLNDENQSPCGVISLSKESGNIEPEHITTKFTGSFLPSLVTGEKQLISQSITKKLDRSSTLSEFFIDGLQESLPFILSRSWFPPTLQQKNELITNLEGISQLIIDYHTVTGGRNQNIVNDKKAENIFLIDNLLKTNLDDAFHSSNLEIFVELARTFLHNKFLKIGVKERTLMQWLERMVLESSSLSPRVRNSQNPFPTLKEKFDIKTKQIVFGDQSIESQIDKEETTYKIKFEMVGASTGVKAGFGAGGFIGNVTITETSSTETTKPKKKFGFWMIEIGVGIGSPGGTFGGGIITGTGSTYYKREFDDFLGMFELRELSIEAKFASLGPESARRGGILFGNRVFPPLEIQIDTNMIDFGIGIECKFWTGRIYSSLDKAKAEATYQTNNLNIIRQAQLSQKVHFKIPGSSVVSEAGREAIRYFLASELSLFRTKVIELEIIGHTDLTGTTEKNKDLSLSRAKNVLQSIKDSLGADLRCKVLSPIGKGEEEAIANGATRHKYEQKFRRVDVKLDGRFVIIFTDIE